MKYEQLQMNLIEEEIALELVEKEEAGAPSAGGAPATTAEAIPEKEILRSGRTPFILHDFDPPHDKEMAVFTNAKKLSEYIFVITEKSPKKFRWSIITRLQNASVDVVENLYRANFERGEERIKYQKSAMVSLNLVDFYAETARIKQAINLHQTAVIARQLSECKKLLSGWVKATKQRGK